MPIKLYISQANQAHNAGPGGYTEKAGMDAISRALAAQFKGDDRFKVKRNVAGSRVDTAVENTNEANAWGADYYVALHSNAGGVGARGTIGFYHSGSSKGKKLCAAIVKAVSPLSPGADPGIRTMDGFIEVGRPNAPACLIELEAHDWVTGVKFLTEQKKAIARALYEGICRGVGLAPLPASGKIALTDQNISIPRQKKPHRAGWWNLGLVPYIERLRAQGQGKRVKTGRDDVVIVPVPRTRPKWWRKMFAWKKSQR